MEDKNKKFFWKGKRVTERVYKNRCRQQQIGKSIRSVYGTKNELHNLKNDTNSKFVEIDGRRIVHLKTLGQELFCKKCDSILSLTDIVEEKCHGLVSEFCIVCRKCKAISNVSTDKQHNMSVQNKHYDVNTKAVIGILNGGMDNTHLNKLLSALNIPELNYSIFKIHEKEVGKVEEMVHDNCRTATEERQQTLNNIEEIKLRKIKKFYKDL